MISEDKIKNAMENLGIDGEITEKKIFDNFIDSFLESKNEDSKNELIGDKIALTLHLDEERHKNGSAFLIPVKNYCKKCSSKGYIPEREKILKPSGCPDCDGTGIKTVPCKKCNSKGYIDGAVCSVCNGTGKYRLYKTKDRPKDFYCGRCQGTGKIQRVSSGPNIVDFEICSKCKGAGFNINFPVVKASQAKDLGGMINQKMEKVNMKPVVFGQIKEAMEKAGISGAES